MKDMFRRVIEIMMGRVLKVDDYTHLSMKQGTIIHGHKELDVVFKEFSQLDDKNIFDPQDIKRLSTKTKYEVLNLLTMVKEIRDEKIKGRAYVNGRK